MEFYATEESDKPRFKRVRAETKAEADRYTLFEAVSNGDIEHVVEMIAESPELLAASLPGPQGHTLLSWAAAQGQYEVARSLLDLGEQVDGRTHMGQTPLMMAAINGNVDLIRMLCERGADVNAYEPNSALFPLKSAIESKNLHACQTLISLGADVIRPYSLTSRAGGVTTALKVICTLDYIELMIWLLDTGRIKLDWAAPFAKVNLIHFAAVMGGASIARLLLERGLRFDLASFDARNEYSGNAIELADSYEQFHVVECILRFCGEHDPVSEGEKGLKKPPAVDLLCHRLLWMQPKLHAADGLTDPQTRTQPWDVLEALARIDFLARDVSRFNDALKSRGWSAFFAQPAEKFELFFANTHAIVANAFKRPLAPEVFIVPAAQQMQLLVEWMSDACSQHAPFSRLKLTRETEQVMNQMFDLQRELMLTAIAHLRAKFEQHVQSLPALCMSLYVSRTHQLNEPDLYRKMTEEWGLYDPVARAVLRLVKEAYGKLQQLEAKRLPPKFAALSPAEQLGHVMAQLLDEWDKIPEIVEALRNGSADKDVEFLDVLLFQQWRLFCEAFGVMKPRYSQFGPRRPEGLETEPGMEVDVQKSELPGSSGAYAPAAPASQ